MRFKITLNIDNTTFRNRLPLNYQYEMSAALYKILYSANEEYAAWLHNNGYLADKLTFKLFTFSRLQIQNYRIKPPFIVIQSDTVEWLISFLPEQSTQEFIQGLFKEQSFDLGNRQANVRFQVKSVETVPPPEFEETMIFETLSPACIVFKRDDGGEDYIAPDNPQASEQVKINLLNKYKAFMGEDFPETDFPFALKALTAPKSSLIAIKSGTPQETKIRGFMCKFQLTAPVELIKIAYECGVGGKNSQGFGMVKNS